jgi:hypothetical protein
MAPKKDKTPPSSVLGSTKMSQAMVMEMEERGVIAPSAVRVPPKKKVYAKAEPDEVIVFKDFFSAGLRFPLDPMVVGIFSGYGVFMHQMIPTLLSG